RNGKILAMVSWPTYDDNLFAGGISATDYQRLLQDPLHPLLNQAIAGEYPTGSTFKLFTASAGLQEGVINRDTRIFDPGAIYLPNKYAPNNPALAQKFVCWLPGGHGWETVTTALRDSCDVFFYQVAGGYKDQPGLGIDRMVNYTRLFGFGDLTKIDLPAESKGLVPDPTWKSRTWREIWTTGDTYNFGIGQGFFLGTPIQLLTAAVAIINGGTLYRPQIVEEIRDTDGHVVRPFKPEVIRKVPISPENLAIVREGMHQVVHTGTATLANVPGIDAAGKTGTAEFCAPDPQRPGHCQLDKEGHLLTHGWFIAYAPYDNPEIAVVVFVGGRGQGALVAAPIAGDILAAYFNVKNTIVLPPPPENLRSGAD
ncbi:MAG: penicillin-binding protein 2, partial [Chloroflexi bacterium]|nr:penicillin-binding protein 2 [Chloroflexota bacterium]